ncbi:hypothetical protein NUW58_g394 [Xylaria curta]|uniref:Uncharacterized protein n=1 Tax=Xylaria curta TaxID=42375 RepID=A0ACC1PPD1_9PEZI|nr:hypothetical protein NUW58_g394 [Xylaria curta]
MAGSASTTSSTSHTLTHAPSLSFLSALTDPTKSSGGMEMSTLFEAIKASNRHDFLQPSASLPNASLQFAKATLDAYASQLSDEQQQRQKEANKKRKRADQGRSPIEVLKVRKLHVDGFESGQVWQQAKRIITSTLQDAEQMLQELEDRSEIQKRVDEVTDSSEPDEGDPDNISDLSDADSIGHSGEEVENEELEDDASDDESEGDLDLLEDEMEGDIGDEVDGGNDSDESEENDDDEPEPLIEDPNGLNDGFFSIDEFNKQTQMWEDADARADPNVDQGSEDEELDWHADPFSIKQPAANTKSSKTKKLVRDEDDEMQSSFGDEDNDDDDEGGPTFGDMDLDAPEGDSDIEDELEAEDNAEEDNANDIFYRDFFAPPRRKGAKQSRPKPMPPPLDAHQTLSAGQID